MLGYTVETADRKKIFSKGHKTNWTYSLYTITEVKNDTISSYNINNSPEIYNEALSIQLIWQWKQINRLWKYLFLLFVVLLFVVSFPTSSFLFWK